MALLIAYAAARTMHRNPTWQVDMSIGCEMRAAGRWRRQ
jgi:hypothetical protein